MKSVLVSLMCVIMLFNLCHAESVLLFDDIQVKEDQTVEYQSIYLAGLCVNSVESEDTYESIMHCRAICEKISIQTTEHISYWLSPTERYICLTDDISFSENVSVQFESEYIETSVLKRYLLPATEMTERSKDYMTIKKGQDRYSILLKDFIGCFKGVKTTKASLILRSPYDSDDLNDAYITRFNNVSSLVDGNTILLPMLDDFGLLKEYLNEDENLPWNK